MQCVPVFYMSQAQFVRLKIFDSAFFLIFLQGTAAQLSIIPQVLSPGEAFFAFW